MKNNQDKKCSICRGGSMGENSELDFGPWMYKNDITVHYHCLLLSTHLPQRGDPDSGMNGFYMRDIRAEIAAAEHRICTFCGRIGASIQCHTCKAYFDIECGIRSNCLFQFVGEFKSFCNYCYPLDEFQKKMKNCWKQTICCICHECFGPGYIPTQVLYPPCCQRGFVHRVCMQKYALSAGYYLRCLWCKCRSFRESIKYQGIFVPDREAVWETTEGYRDLHRGHRRCDMDKCLCPKGREYSTNRWDLINCNGCGSIGVHYPNCLPTSKYGKIPSMDEFRCETCAKTEKDVKNKSEIHLLNNTIGNFDLYLRKDCTISVMEESQTESFNESDSTQTNETVIPLHKLQKLISKELKDASNSSETATSSSMPSFPSNSKSNLNKDSNRCNPYFEEFEMIDFNEDFELNGVCKLRINMKSPRFANKSLKEIFNHPEILKESDILETTGDASPFQKMQKTFVGKEGNEFLLQKLISKELKDASNSSETATSSSMQSFPSNSKSNLNKDSNGCNPCIEELEMIDFNEDFELNGVCKLRINMKSPRFANKSLKEIFNNPEILKESDILETTGDASPFQKMQKTFVGKEGNEFLLQKLISNELKDASNSSETATSSSMQSFHIECPSNSESKLNKDSNGCNPYFEEFEMIDFNEDFELNGVCKLRINMKSPRFANKRPYEIFDNPEILKESDILETTGDASPFQKMQKTFVGKELNEFLLRYYPQLCDKKTEEQNENV